MSITEFLTARYDEEEVIARQHDDFINPQLPRLWNGPGQYPVMTGASLLADIAAKRAIVEEHSSLVDGKPYDKCLVCYQDPESDGSTYPCPTMRLLAQPFAEHPDFDPAWRV